MTPEQWKALEELVNAAERGRIRQMQEYAKSFQLPVPDETLEKPVKD